jgi:hypothetical protein
MCKDNANIEYSQTGMRIKKIMRQVKKIANAYVNSENLPASQNFHNRSIDSGECPTVKSMHKIIPRKVYSGY